MYIQYNRQLYRIDGFLSLIALTPTNITHLYGLMKFFFNYFPINLHILYNMHHISDNLLFNPIVQYHYL